MTRIIPKLVPVVFGQQYYKKLLTIQRANLIAYWPMGEPSGSVSYDFSGNNYDGAYTGVTLGEPGIGDGKTCPYFDGANDYNNVYSSGLASAFNGQEGTISIWGKIYNVSVWTDSLLHRLCNFYVNESNYLSINKTGTDNIIQGYYKAGDIIKSVNYVTSSPIVFFHASMTWSLSSGVDGELKFYFNGSQVETTQTALGTWSGSPASTTSCIGSSNLNPSNVWYGWLAHAALWSTPLTADEIAKLAVL